MMLNFQKLFNRSDFVIELYFFFCKTNHRPIFLLYLLDKKKKSKKERKAKKRKTKTKASFSFTKRSKPPCCYVLYVKSIACYLFNDISLFIVLLIYIFIFAFF